MNHSVGGSENGYVFPPQTAAGQALWERRGHERLGVAIGDSQTSLFDANAFGNAVTDDDFTPLAPYDYVLDEAFGADAPVAEVVEDELETPKPKRLFSWVARNIVLPSADLEVTDWGDKTATWSLRVTMQKPNETFQVAKMAAKAAGQALAEEFNEVLEADKPDEEAGWATGFVCGQVILKHLKRLGEPSEADLIGSITREYHDLPKEPEFRALIVRLRKWPGGLEGYTQSLAQLDGQAVVDYLPLVPAFYDFCAKHEIDPNEVLGN